ncbi:type VI secretion system baseplate subunit TssE [Sinorhizobium fredii]|uniref:type VI secretion system baseplate subunit TssE n=1 Tax=Rhizobium fredii TaxID=380 RepID=UPI0004B6034F|nr:GPW/gp25 family protein [Sinorhizobium fredii]
MAEEVRYHVPLIHAFRDAFRKGDARKAGTENGEYRTLSEDEFVRRRGLSESHIRAIVLDDISAILSTVDLQSAVDIADLNYLSRSILNFGLYDIMHLTSEDAGVAEIERNIVAALLAYEPRIRRESLQVEWAQRIDDVQQKIRLSIYAEVANRPANIPLDFTAEVDLSTGAATVT